MEPAKQHGCRIRLGLWAIRAVWAALAVKSVLLAVAIATTNHAS
jgi:hypothetical protein